MKLPMPHGARWAVVGLDYNRVTQISLVWLNRPRSGVTIHGVRPRQLDEDFRLRGRIEHMMLQTFWRKLGAA